MAVLSNTMMQGTAAISDEGDPYQIEKSLRFEADDSSRLKRQPQGSGNRKKFTIAWWQKKHYENVPSNKNCGTFSALTDNNNHFTIGIENSGQGNHNSKQSGTDELSVGTSAYKFLDTSAWMHYCVVVDTENAVQDDRFLVYINGKNRFTAGTRFDQNDITEWSKAAVNHYIGYSEISGWGYPDITLADVYHIDGQALSPAAFGSFDSSGCWNPKAFALPVPNNGTTWSSTLVSSTGSFYGGMPATQAFNGNAADAADASATGGTLTWTPPSVITFTTSVELKAGGAQGGDQTITLTDENDNVTSLVTTVTDWITVKLGSGTLKSLALAASAGNYGSWYGLRIDGVTLVDGQTNQTEYQNPHGAVSGNFEAILTSNASGGTEGFYGSGPDNGHWKQYGFDGNLTTETAAADADKTLTLTFNPALKWSRSIEIYNKDQRQTVGINGSTALDASTEGAWSTVSTAGGELSTLTFTSKDTGASETGRFSAIKIDEQLLIQDQVDNSFHLKFNDTTADRNLGYSQVMNTPTGALPIYGPGADETAKSSLVFAMPGYDLNDHHHTIKGSGSAKSVTVHADTTTNANRPKFYDKSMSFDGTGDYLEIADGTDWDFGTGDFTVELWTLPTNTSGYVGLIGSRDSSGWGMMYAPGDSYKLKFYTPTERASGANAITNNKWQHVAVSRSGSTIKGFVNGVQVFSHSDSDTADGDASLKIGTGWPSGMSNLNGYMQDVRIYKGTAKYTSAFIPPVRNDFSPTNLTASNPQNNTVSRTISGHAESDPISQLFDGNGSTNYRLLANSGDNTISVITFGTPLNGDLTVNCSNFNSQVTAHASIDGGSSWSNHPNNGGHTFTFSGVSNLTELRIRAQHSSGYSTTYWYWVKINGVEINTIDGGANIDALNDTPTNGGIDTGQGGEVTGNFCTWNPLNSDSTLSKGNLRSTVSGKSSYGTFLLPTTGKWYWEIDANSASYIGIDNRTCGGDDYVHYNPNGQYQEGGGGTTNYGASFTTGDFIGVAVNMDDEQITFYKNNASQGVINFSDVDLTSSKPVVPLIYSDTAQAAIVNFGQRPFKHAAPAGYKCLCTQNLPDTFSGAELNNPSKYFDIIKYTGDSVDGRVLGGLNFKPDLIWIKQRSSATWHALWDAIRGAGSSVFPNATDAAGTDAHITSFNDNGVTLQHVDSGTVNADGGTYVGWFWDCGTAAVTASTDGTVTPNGQWASPTAGFSITTFEDLGSAGTIGHALGAKPDMFILKRYSPGGDWNLWHKDLTSQTAGYINLHDNAAEISNNTNIWGNTAPTNTVYSAGTDLTGSSKKWMIYGWTSIPGFSAFGSYRGNSSTSGHFIYTGFRPKWLLRKRYITHSGTDYAESWILQDSTRDPYNEPMQLALYPNLANVEQDSYYDVTFHSNGFNMKDNSHATNNSAASYIYAAFAEHPFKTARAA